MRLRAEAFGKPLDEVERSKISIEDARKAAQIALPMSIDVRRVFCTGRPTSDTLQSVSKLGHDRDTDLVVFLVDRTARFSRGGTISG
ncbi:hypothetical protein XI09_05540 [Bradyrhizobium sp. CCBAU 11386]|nr:hypothetical protein [Bradyrhizobium sp. CCBAU 11386]